MSDSWNGLLGELQRKGAARQPATFGEILSTSWNASGLDTLTGSGKPVLDALHEYQVAAETALGRKIEIDKDAYGAPEYHAKVITDAIAASDLDAETKTKLNALSDVRALGIRKAHKIESDAAEVSGATYGLSGNAAAWLTGMARQFVDPVNLATAPLGGPLKGPLGTMLLREFAIGAVTQAVQEPIIQKNRADHELESGFNKAIGNIFESGTANVAFGLVGRGLTSLYWKAAQNLPAVPRPESWERFSFTGGIKYRPNPDKAAGGLENASLPRSGLSADDLHAAARLEERNQALDASVPSQQLRAELPEKIDRAAEALNQGRIPVDLESRFETPTETYGPPSPAPHLDFTPKRIAFSEGDVQPLIRPDGSRLAVRPVVLELSDLVISHNADGVVNPNYPAALQPRDRAAPASRTWISQTAPKLEPELLGRQPTAGQGAPVIGPDGVVESGNGRALLIARAYDKHPERAAAYREWLTRQGYDVGEFEFPVLVRVRDGALADRAGFAREANVSATASLSVREQALSDAKRLDSALLENFKGGNIADLQNAAFVRAFADRVVAPEERPQFIGGDERLSLAGAQRLEAAMVARGWADERLITGLYETTDPNTRAILGAFADTAPVAARLRAALDEGRVPAEADPSPALLEAWRLVADTRDKGLRMIDAVDQIDLENGAIGKPVRDAVQLYFRDDALRHAAGRDVVAARIRNALDRALDRQLAVGDLFGESMTVKANLKAAKLEGVAPEDMTFDFRGLTGTIDASQMSAKNFKNAFRKLAEGQPFDTIEEAIARAPEHQKRLVLALESALPFASRSDAPASVKNPGIKANATEIAQKIARKDYNSPREVTDYVRAAATVSSPDQADAIARELGKQFRVVDEGWASNPAGYFDRKLSVVFEDGTVGEVQIWPREISEAKPAGQKLYKARRASELPNVPTEEEKAYWAAVTSRLGEAWRPLIGGKPNAAISSPYASLASASENVRRASQVTSAGLTGRQPLEGLSTKASLPETTASLASQSKNVTPASIDRKVGPEGGENKPKLPGDAQLRADAERALTEAGGDMEIMIELPDGTVKRGSARELFAEGEADAKAAAELKDCMGGGA